MNGEIRIYELPTFGNDPHWDIADEHSEVTRTDVGGGFFQFRDEN
jgi:hypothetical protein